MKLGIKLSGPKAKMPFFATEGAACFDIYSTYREPSGSNSMLYSTGVFMDIPDGYVVKVYSRSGHGFNSNIRLCNSTGIIDADYTGEIKVKLTYDGPAYRKPEWPSVGDRVAQAMLEKLVDTELVQIYEMKETARGENGFGSTGHE